jgi:hypothetical protein
MPLQALTGAPVGIVYVDFKTQQRTPTASAQFFAAGRNRVAFAVLHAA